MHAGEYRREPGHTHGRAAARFRDTAEREEGHRGGKEVYHRRAEFYELSGYAGRKDATAGLQAESVSCSFSTVSDDPVIRISPPEGQRSIFFFPQCLAKFHSARFRSSKLLES